MTYTEKRNQLLANIKKQVENGTFIRSFCPTEGLRDFMFCEDIDGVKTVFHKQEIFAATGAGVGVGGK